MTRNSTSAIGAFHPIIFCVVIYGISLFMAFLVCTAIYNSTHNESDDEFTQTEVKQDNNISFASGQTASLR